MKDGAFGGIFRPRSWEQIWEHFGCDCSETRMVTWFVGECGKSRPLRQDHQNRRSGGFLLSGLFSAVFSASLSAHDYAQGHAPTTDFAEPAAHLPTQENPFRNANRS